MYMKVLLAVLAASLLTAAAPSASAEPLAGTLAKIKETGTITLGYRESSVPFAYLDDQQRPIGYSMDLCNRVVGAVKATLGMPDLTVRLQPVDSSNRIPLVQNGTVDLECGSTANYLQRQKQVGFSVSTFWVAKKFIAKASSRLKTIADLKGKTVVVTHGTDTADLIKVLNEERKLGMAITYGKDHAESMLAMESGRALAFMEDDVLVAGLRAKSRDPKSLVLLQDAFGGDPYALMFRRDDPQFKQVVDATLTKLMASGEIEATYAKWFESPIPPQGVNIAYAMPEALGLLFKNPSDKAAH